MANIAIEQVTSDSISAQITNIIGELDFDLHGSLLEWLLGDQMVGYVTLPQTGTYGGYFTFPGLTPSTTYLVGARAHTSMGIRTFEGVTVTTLPAPGPTPGQRPALFYWNTWPKYSGQTFDITALEWNNFTTNINAVRQYKGLLPYSGFTQVLSGMRLTAAIYNQAVEAIKGIPGYGGYLTYVSSGDTITAYLMNLIVNEINAVP